MYAALSIEKLIEALGFVNITILKAGETLIKNPGALDLYERSDQSLYIETMKV